MCMRVAETIRIYSKKTAIIEACEEKIKTLTIEVNLHSQKLEKVSIQDNNQSCNAIQSMESRRDCRNDQRTLRNDRDVMFSLSTHHQMDELPGIRKSVVTVLDNISEDVDDVSEILAFGHETVMFPPKNGYPRYQIKNFQCLFTINQGTTDIISPEIELTC
ncbi:hypothetical protein RF11_06581 [Thelohanellus kitauei]|uniref:Uncharacterized protein n=1 Tax=Thelohanellus kitauei TaxID=669202 RepID=A0A0C2JYW8_THEKT|nr:hypothetical protein RF11_06581 [Thelohanellus kitauei]